MAALGTDLPSDKVREQLRRIIESPDFDASERNRRFLEHIVAEALAGRAERIKAYSIATSVFGRDDSFDPQMDPIVRIEASRLRRSLERYYLTCGSEDPIRITIPKGAYVPEFAAQETAEAAAAADPVPSEFEAQDTAPPAPRWRLAVAGLGAVIALAMAMATASWFAGYQPFAADVETPAFDRDGPSIFVMPFAEDGKVDALPNFTRGLTRELVVALTRFKDIFVFGPETSFDYGTGADLRQVASNLDVDFILTGGTTVLGDRFAVDAQLVDTETGQYIWATRVEGDLNVDGILAARDEVANKVARALAQPYGVIFANQAQSSESKAPGSLSSYDCVLRFYLYWKSYRREFYPSVHDCLEKAIVNDPEYAEAYAALSLIHSDAYRFGFEPVHENDNPREKALVLAKRSIEISPNLARGYHALMLAHWLNNDVELSFEAGFKGLAANPHDTELMAELGMRHVFRGQGETGMALLREAYARNPGQPSGYRMAIFLHHYLEGRFEEAYLEAKKIDATNLIYTHVAMALAASKRGRADEARDAVDRILALAPNFGEIIVADLEKRNITPDIVSAVVEGLRDAGLFVPGEIAADTDADS